MPTLAGPVHAVALVLALAGAAKVLRPTGTATALRVLGLPGGRAGARVLGAAEVALAAWLLAAGGAPAGIAVGAAHLGFTVAAVGLRRRAATCGCFGRGAPVTGAHLVTTLIAAAACLAAAVGGLPSLPESLDGSPGAGLPYLLLVALLAGLEVAVLTALAEVQSTVAELREAARLRAGAAS